MQQPGCAVDGDGQRREGWRSCLIAALTISDFIDFTTTASARRDVGAQLGVLTLAAVLRRDGYAVDVFNIDEWFLEFLRVREAGGELPSFLGFLLDRLTPSSYDFFGLSSICSSYPLTLRLAREIKRLRPDAPIILGGPQASVVDVATMDAFQCVDAIVRGEAEETLPVVIDHLLRGAPLDRIAGVTFRRGGEVVRNPNAPVIEDLDCLPLPAFDLDPKLKDRGGIHLEIGRGCPFSCTFCSTNDFFRRHFRLKSTAQTITEMQQINAEYGITYFSMVHDMYTVNRKRVTEFCKALLREQQDWIWGCSARTDCIDDDLIALMAKAGCSGIFFGIETGSQRLQAVINKKLDLDEARARIDCADRHKIQIAVALITGFPEETRDDLRDTVHFFVDSLRYDNAEPQLSLLAPLAATPIHDEYKSQLIFDDIFSDMSHQGWRQDAEDLELIKQYPDIFPNFYAVPMRHLERRYVKDVHDFVTYLASWFRWLAVGILQDSGDLLAVFDDWQRWLTRRRAAGQDAETGIAPYYTHRQFRLEFLEFVRTWYCEQKAAAPLAITALAASEGWSPAAQSPYSGEIEEAGDFAPEVYPYPRQMSVAVGVDYKELIAALRSKRDLRDVSPRETTLVFRRTDTASVQVWQMTPLSALLLTQCSGSRSVEELARGFSGPAAGLDGIPPAKIAMYGLFLLHQQGFVGLSRRPLERRPGDKQPDGIACFIPPPHFSANQQPWPSATTAA